MGQVERVVTYSWEF